ncbi:sensor histidine kinase [Niallia sp. 03133]|uniref:sensor histidine kinase n=1 Tax=Niallia sp. 03133 TaxID=3458060 RepID=UPI0040446176
MIKKYLSEKKSWIFFILFIQLFSLFIASMDQRLSFHSMLYISFLALLFLIIFLLLRYQKETAFYKSLAEREDNLDLTSITDPERPFEKIIEECMRNQTELLKKEAQQNSILLEQEKDELLAWIHEVKTPLTALHLMIDRLENEPIKVQLTYEWLRIHLLLDQQLHHKRIPFIQNDLYIEKANIEAIIFEEIKTLQSWCIQKGIGFDIELKAAEVLSDSKWLAFIVRQLLSNAVKYSVASDIMISSFQKGENNILQIKDSGIGIDAKDLPRIFDKGFTSTTHHMNHHATGMGLYLSKKVADSLLIHIEVESMPNKGTIFTLTFPKKNDFVHLIHRQQIQ